VISSDTDPRVPKSLSISEKLGSVPSGMLTLVFNELILLRAQPNRCTRPPNNPPPELPQEFEEASVPPKSLKNCWTFGSLDSIEFKNAVFETGMVISADILLPSLAIPARSPARASPYAEAAELVGLRDVEGITRSGTSVIELKLAVDGRLGDAMVPTVIPVPAGTVLVTDPGILPPP